MRSIAIINQKGGCGKTTTAVNLSSCLADVGKRVLLIDCDPQSHASIGLGINTEELPCSTYDIFIDPEISIFSAAHRVIENLDVLPSSVILTAVEQQLSGQPDRENRLRRKMEACEEHYDYILVDCPPNIGLLTFNALVACKESLVVMEPSNFSLHGASKVIQTIQLVRDQLGLRKRVRILLTLFDKRTKYARNFLEEAKARFGQGMLQTVIRRTTRFKEASTLGVPISDFEGSCSGAEDFRKLADEIISHESLLNIDDFEAVAGIKDRQPAQELDTCILSHPGPHLLGESVLFSIAAPEARTVKLTGSFTHWSLEEAIPLTRNNKGIWMTKVDLGPGRHLYKYIIDGVWHLDPANKNRAYPEENCIIEVPIEIERIASLPEKAKPDSSIERE